MLRRLLEARLKEHGSREYVQVLRLMETFDLSEAVSALASVPVPAAAEAFIASGIESGQFSNASEVVREGLRLLEQRQSEDKAKVEWLRAAVQEGIDAIERGDYTVLDTHQDIDDMMDGIGRERLAGRIAELASA